MIAYHDLPYLDLVNDILVNGVEKDDRTGTGTRSVFGRQMRFRLHDNVIPLLTTKKMHTRSIVHELLWYFKGDTNIKYLNDNGVTIWDEWADENGDLGPVYGKQWRAWNTGKTFWAGECDNDRSQGGEQPVVIDQLAIAIDTLKKNPNSRRILISAWNVSELNEMALLPCHVTFQFYVANGRLSCMLNQRSCDVGLGVPFNIVQYSILTCMVAQVVGLQPGDFVWHGGDVHIYKNHIEALREQVTRQAFLSPTLWLNPEVKDIDQFTFDDIRIDDYQCHPSIKMDVSV